MTKKLSPAEYRAIHDAAVTAYEASTPVDYRYSALALRKAVDAALAVRDTLNPTPSPRVADLARLSHAEKEERS